MNLSPVTLAVRGIQAHAHTFGAGSLPQHLCRVVAQTLAEEARDPLQLRLRDDLILTARLRRYITPHARTV